MPAVTTTTRPGWNVVGRAPEQAPAEFDDVGVDRTARGALGVVGAGQQDRTGAVLEQLGDDPRALLGGLAGAVDRLRHALAEVAVVVDRRALDVGERQAAESLDGLVGADRSGSHVVDELSQGRLVHRFIVPCDRAR